MTAGTANRDVHHFSSFAQAQILIEHQMQCLALSTRQLREEVWSISPDDPLSMTGVSTWTCDMHRPGWFVRTVATARIACTATDWIIGAVVTAFEDDVQIFEKIFAEKTIARDLM